MTSKNTSRTAPRKSQAAASLPQTLLEAVRYFSDPDVALAYVADLRWPDGPVCPACGGKEHSFLTTRRLWKCRACKKQFSVKVGTIFECSPIGLDKWLPAVWLIVNSKNGVSSHELARSVGVTQKTAWFMAHRIRFALQQGSFVMSGEVEVDETFIGGKARNMHKHIRAQKIHGTGGMDKTMVFGILERNGTQGRSRVQTTILPDRVGTTLKPAVRQHVAKGSAVFTDAHTGYTGLEGDFDHRTVDHATKYVEGIVHTNGIENFWALFKRGLHGTYVCPQAFHLHRYLDERAFTFNERDARDGTRMAKTVRQIADRRLTWKRLTGKEQPVDGEPEAAQVA